MIFFEDITWVVLFLLEMGMLLLLMSFMLVAFDACKAYDFTVSGLAMLIGVHFCFFESVLSLIGDWCAFLTVLTTGNKIVNGRH